ncbi:MAG: tetratricopeptide repeat protein [Candidatus Coatesbacteria bacterium]|nr:tetratricopeptide repeat protein [Candidatus Coatesbacteria bacterium]
MELIRCPWLAPAALFAVSSLVFLLLLSTLSPTVHTGDSGELITSAWSLGIAHNPGYPVYSLLGRAAGFLGLGSPAFRINLFSAHCAVLSSVFVFLTVLLYSRRMYLAAIAALLLPISATIWWQASDAEVYTLYLLSLSVLVYLLARFIDSDDLRWLYCAAFVFGLSLGNHISLVMMVPAIVSLLWRRRSVRSFPAALVCLMLLLVGLSCYIYLPIRASCDPAINWSDPDTLEGVIYHAGAAEHRGKAILATGYESGGQRFLSILGLFASQYGPATAVFLIVALVGWISLRRNRTLLIAAALVVIMNIVYIQFINVVPLQATGFGYPSYLVLVLLFSAGLMRVAAGMPRLGAALAVLIVFVAIISNYHPNDRSEDYLTYDYGSNLLSHLPVNSALFAKGDNQIFSLLYLQAIEGHRADVALFDAYGDLAVPLRSFAGFRFGELQPKIEFVCRDFDACFFGFTPDSQLGSLAKDAVPFGALFRTGKDIGLPETIWPLYELRGLDDASIFRRMLSQEITSTYHFRKAEYLRLRGDDEGWKRELLAASQAGGEVDFMRARLGDGYAEAGMIDEAIDEFRAAISLNPNKADYYNQLGVLYRRCGRDGDAIKVFQKALSLEPKESSYAYNLGNALSGADRLDEAISYYERALEGADNPAEIHNNLGQAYRRIGNLEKTIEHFRESIRIDPKYVAPRLNLGAAYAAVGQYYRAIAEYKTAIEIEPNSKESHSNLGTAYKRVGRNDLAIEHFKRAIEIDPEFFAARINLGSTYAQMGQFDEAIPEYEAALRIDPDYASAYYDLGAIYYTQHETGPCRRAWSKFLSLESTGSRTQHVRRLLSEMGESPE